MDAILGVQVDGEVEDGRGKGKASELGVMSVMGLNDT